MTAEKKITTPEPEMVQKENSKTSNKKRTIMKKPKDESGIVKISSDSNNYFDKELKRIDAELGSEYLDRVCLRTILGTDDEALLNVSAAKKAILEITPEGVLQKMTANLLFTAYYHTLESISRSESPDPFNPPTGQENREAIKYMQTFNNLLENYLVLRNEKQEAVSIQDNALN